MTKASETRASRHPKGTTDPDGDGKMGGSLSQAEADRRAAAEPAEEPAQEPVQETLAPLAQEPAPEPAHNPEDPPEGNGLAASGATTRAADPPAASGTSSIQTTDEAAAQLVGESGYVGYGPDGEWHWFAESTDDPQVEDLRPATSLEKSMLQSAGGSTERIRGLERQPDVDPPEGHETTEIDLSAGSPTQFAHDLGTFVLAARALSRWRARLFGEDAPPAGIDIHHILRTTDISFDRIPGSVLHGSLITLVGCGEAAEDLLKRLAPDEGA